MSFSRNRSKTDKRQQREALWKYLSDHIDNIPTQDKMMSDIGYRSRSCLQCDLDFLRRNKYIAPAIARRSLPIRVTVTYTEREA